MNEALTIRSPIRICKIYYFGSNLAAVESSVNGREPSIAIGTSAAVLLAEMFEYSASDVFRNRLSSAGGSPVGKYDCAEPGQRSRNSQRCHTRRTCPGFAIRHALGNPCEPDQAHGHMRRRIACGRSVAGP